MGQKIFLRVGTQDRITLSELIDALRNFLLALKDLDATITRDPRGSLIWDVVALEKNSPPLVGVAPHQKPTFRKQGVQDYSNEVESQLIENARIFQTGTERTQFLSDSALKHLESLAKKTSRLGPMAVFQSDNGASAPKNETPITSETLSNVKKLTSPRYSAFGSIKGSLDAISIHHDFEFRVWDENTRKPVRCKFSRDDLERVKTLLGSRVTVLGVLTSNSAGTPISIEAEEFTPASQTKLPTIAEMSGLVHDFTDGKSLKDYMEELSDE